MTADRDRVPWAVKTPPWGDMAPGTRLSDADAQTLFREHYLPGAVYVACDRGYIRRVVARPYADAKGLNFHFDGRPCVHGHIDARKLRRRSTPVCLSCVKARKMRRWVEEVQS